MNVTIELTPELLWVTALVAYLAIGLVVSAIVVRVINPADKTSRIEVVAASCIAWPTVLLLLAAVAVFCLIYFVMYSMWWLIDGKGE